MTPTDPRSNPLTRGVARASDEMIIHHSRRLHEGVADRGANELEAALQEVAAHGVTFRRPGRDILHRPSTIHDGLSPNELPEIAVEAAKLPPHLEKRFRVLKRRGDLSRLRTIPASLSRAATFFGPYFAIFSASNWSKARR